MKTPETLDKMLSLFRLGIEIANLPTASLRFQEHLNPQLIRDTYSKFTQPHPRYKIIKTKAVGVALVDLSSFQHPDSYLESVRQRGYAAPQRRKAYSRGYRMREIDRNDHVDAIHQINTSVEMRQGRPMDQHYLEKREYYEPQPNLTCFGIFDAQDKLSAYCSVAFFGNFAATDQLLGLKNNDGVMYMLLADIICQMIEEKRLDYFMYDTFFGAQPGLRDFKRRVGFRPYRARYTIH